MPCVSKSVYISATAEPWPATSCQNDSPGTNQRHDVKPPN